MPRRSLMEGWRRSAAAISIAHSAGGDRVAEEGQGHAVARRQAEQLVVGLRAAERPALAENGLKLLDLAVLLLRGQGRVSHQVQKQHMRYLQLRTLRRLGWHRSLRGHSEW